VQRQPIDVFGGQQHGQHAGAGHGLFDQLSRLVGGNRSRFAGFAGVDLADVFDHADLHRHDVQLFAGFFADGVLAAATGAGQLGLGQRVDDFDARQLGRQRLALATAPGRRDDFFGLGDLLCFGFNGRRRLFGQLLGFVEHRQLR